MIPPAVMEECRERARATPLADAPEGRAAAVAIVALWLMAIYLCYRLAVRWAR